MLVAIADASALFAAADERDSDHASTLDALERSEYRLIVPALVVSEVSYLIGTRLGAAAEAAFFDDLEHHDVDLPTPRDWPRIADLIRQYADFPLGGADASVIATAERLDTPTVITLDRRHFSAVRPRHCNALELLPA